MGDIQDLAMIIHRSVLISVESWYIYQLWRPVGVWMRPGLGFGPTVEECSAVRLRPQGCNECSQR
jgi:hypothetical protein